MILEVMFSDKCWKMHPLVDEEPAKKIPKFNPFSGSSRRLDGRPALQSPPSTFSPVPKQQHKEDTGGTNVLTSSASTSRQFSGKLVFGSNVENSSSGKQKVNFICLTYVLFFILWCMKKYFFQSNWIQEVCLACNWIFHLIILAWHCYYYRLPQRRTMKILFRRLKQNSKHSQGRSIHWKTKSSSSICSFVFEIPTYFVYFLEWGILWFLKISSRGKKSFWIFWKGGNLNGLYHKLHFSPTIAAP